MSCRWTALPISRDGGSGHTVVQARHRGIPGTHLGQENPQTPNSGYHGNVCCLSPCQKLIPRDFPDSSSEIQVFCSVSEKKKEIIASGPYYRIFVFRFTSDLVPRRIYIATLSLLLSTFYIHPNLLSFPRIVL